MKINFNLYLLGMLAFLLSVTSCQDEPENGDSTPSSITELVDGLDLPEMQEDPVKYWQVRKLKVQTGKIGFLHSTHTLEPTGSQVERNPIKISKENGKIVALSTGDYDENGEISGITDFLFHNEKLAYVISDEYRLFMRDGEIYLWLDKDKEELTKSEEEKREMASELQSRVNELMAAVGAKFSRE